MPHPTHLPKDVPSATAHSPFVLACARAAHEANRAYCLANGDGSQFPWDGAPGWAKDSCIAGVLGVLAGNGPEESHASWMREKALHNWKFGPIKDPNRREHPCFVPYDKLPKKQQMKDHIFVTVVRAMALALELEVKNESDRSEA